MTTTTSSCQWDWLSHHWLLLATTSNECFQLNLSRYPSWAARPIQWIHPSNQRETFWKVKNFLYRWDYASRAAQAEYQSQAAKLAAKPWFPAPPGKNIPAQGSVSIYIEVEIDIELKDLGFRGFRCRVLGRVRVRGSRSRSRRAVLSIHRETSWKGLVR